MTEMGREIAQYFDFNLLSEKNFDICFTVLLVQWSPSKNLPLLSPQIQILRKTNTTQYFNDPRDL